jgi:hypothetical protein
MKTDENVERVVTIVGTDRRLDIRMRAEELCMEDKIVRQNLIENFNMEKVCAKMVPNNLIILSHKTNTDALTRFVLTRVCPL